MQAARAPGREATVNISCHKKLLPYAHSPFLCPVFPSGDSSLLSSHCCFACPSERTKHSKGSQPLVWSYIRQRYEVTQCSIISSLEGLFRYWKGVTIPGGGTQSSALGDCAAQSRWTQCSGRSFPTSTILGFLRFFGSALPSSSGTEVQLFSLVQAPVH